MAGFDMMMEAMRKLIPASVWEMVEKNVVGIKSDTDKIATRLEKIEAQNTTILRILAVHTGNLELLQKLENERLNKIASVIPNPREKQNGHPSET